MSGIINGKQELKGNINAKQSLIGDMAVKQGVDGKDGKDGKDGVDGKDYILTDVDKNEIAELISGTKANAIINSASGETILTTDSANSPLKSMKTFGKSWQNVGGKNLFDYKSLDDIVINANGDKRKGTMFTNSGTYTLSQNGSLANTIYAIVLEADGTFGSPMYFTPSVTISITDGQTLIVCLDDTLIQWVGTAYVQVEMGNSQTPYEEYKGLPPSPNNPQEIHSNGDSGSIEYGVYGGQLFDATITTNKNATVENEVITFNVDTTDDYLVGSYGGTTPLINIPSGSYCVSCSDTNVRVTMYCVINGAYVNIDSTLSPITVSADTFVQGIRVRSINGNSLKGKPFTIMFNNGTTALPFEPYTKQPFTLQTPNGLNGLSVSDGGNYTDSDGKQYLADFRDYELFKNVQNIVELGIADFGNVKVSVDANWYNSEKSYSYEIQSARVGLKNRITGLCTHFTSYSFNDFYGKAIETGCMNGMDYLVVNISKSLGICKTVDEFKQWLTDNNVRFLKALAEPIETDLTEEEIAQYEALMMNYPNTTIINDAGAYTEIVQVCDTQEHIKQNYAPKSEIQEMKEQIAELQALMVNNS